MYHSIIIINLHNCTNCTYGLLILLKIYNLYQYNYKQYLLYTQQTSQTKYYFNTTTTTQKSKNQNPKASYHITLYDEGSHTTTTYYDTFYNCTSISHSIITNSLQFASISTKYTTNYTNSYKTYHQPFTITIFKQFHNFKHHMLYLPFHNKCILWKHQM